MTQLIHNSIRNQLKHLKLLFLHQFLQPVNEFYLPSPKLVKSRLKTLSTRNMTPEGWPDLKPMYHLHI